MSEPDGCTCPGYGPGGLWKADPDCPVPAHRERADETGHIGARPVDRDAAPPPAADQGAAPAAEPTWLEAAHVAVQMQADDRIVGAAAQIDWGVLVEEHQHGLNVFVVGLSRCQAAATLERAAAALRAAMRG